MGVKTQSLYAIKQITIHQKWLNGKIYIELMKNWIGDNI